MDDCAVALALLEMLKNNDKITIDNDMFLSLIIRKPCPEFPAGRATIDYDTYPLLTMDALDFTDLLAVYSIFKHYRQESRAELIERVNILKGIER